MSGCQQLANNDNRARSAREKFAAIDKRRAEEDVGIGELCASAGVTREAWRLIAKGLREPRASTLRKLRRGLDRLLADTIDPRR